MTYTPFRCTECTLMRCTVPNTMCEECAAPLLKAQEYDILFQQPIANTPQSQQPFLFISQGVRVAGAALLCIANGPGILHGLMANIQGGDIRVFDDDINCGNSPQGYSQMMQNKIYEWNNPGLCMLRVGLHVPFKTGLMVCTRGGDFTLHFEDSKGNLYTVPY